MRVYQPQISVKLVKAIKRTEIAPGVPISSRYKGLDSVDLTPFLGETGGVQVSKGIREPCGTFSITFRDSLGQDKSGNKLVVDTVSALVEPMDLIEIRMCRDPTLYAPGKWPPVVMRGIVSAVTRAEAISGQQPARSVTIAGQDFGKILQILQIYYLNNSALDSFYLTEMSFFQKYAPSGDAKIQLANDFLQGVVDNVLNPYLKTLTAFANGEAVGAKVINQWTVQASIKGGVSPFAVNSFYNVSLYQMLATLFDVGPFNELFVEDAEDAIDLVLRPNPFLDVSGNPIQGNKAETVSVTDADIMSMAMTRSDEGVANYYWAGVSRYAFMSNEDAQVASMGGDQKNFVLFDYLNCNDKYYGFRKMETEVVLLDPAYTNVEAQKKDDYDDNTASLTSWMDNRRKILSDSNKDNVVFECGTIQVKGDEHLKAGRQLILTRANAVPVTGYITKVQHSFAPFQGFTTMLSLERVTSFIERAKAETPQYRPEINAGGVS